MLVLGIGGFMHDYNCALVDVEGQRVAMCEAERPASEGAALRLPVRRECLMQQECSCVA